MSKTKLLLTTLFALIIFPINLFAIVPGSLDKTFDVDGKLLFNSATQSSTSAAGTDLAIQPDGKIIVAGSAGASFSIARLNPDSTLDTSFGLSGRINTNIEGNNAACLSIALLSDGKFVAVGSAVVAGSSDNFAIARFNANGSLDTTFGGGDGMAQFDMGSNLQDVAWKVLVQSDGKYVMVGRTGSIAGNDLNFGFMRVNTDGTLDTTFDTDGKLMVSPSTFNDLLWTAAIQPDGKIIGAGQINSTFPTSTLVRLNTNGTLDTTFDGDGIVELIFSNNDSVSGVKAMSDGKLLIGGTASQSVTGPNFIVARLNSNGGLDTTFASAGRTIVNFNGASSDLGQGMTLESNGNIILCGQTNVNGTNDYAIVRFTPNGLLDTTFNGTGKVVTDFSAQADIANECAVQADGKLIVNGRANFISGASTIERFGIARYNLKAKAVTSDFDGDDKTDISVFRASDGGWYLQRSTSGFYAVAFGAVGDSIVPADFSGDGKTDVAVYRPSNNTWYVFNTTDNTFYGIPFGTNGDIPMPADFDGDGKADINVFRPSVGQWFRNNSSNGQFVATPFGQLGDVPTLGDFDGDGKDDIGVFRPSNGVWYRLNSTNNSFFAVAFGQNGDKIVPADYTGDSKTDIAVFRPSNSTWYILRSEDLTFYGIPFGNSTDLPSPGDFDGDGKADQSVYRSGQWFIQQSTNGFLAFPFGLATDKPIPNAFVY